MSQEAVTLLMQIRDHMASMDATLKTLVAQRRAAAPKPIASDRDLDGRFGDPVLKFNPRDWTGAPCKGRRFSECPPDLLDMVADTFEFFATQAEAKNERTNKDKPVAEFKRADAARARGWAKRMREGKHKAPTSSAAPAAGWSDSGEDEPSADWATSPGDGF